MWHPVKSVGIPRESGVHQYLHDADFADAFSIQLVHPERSALDIYLHMVAKTPAWVSCAMNLRNRTVALAGLKTSGIGPADPAKPGSAYRTGDQIGVLSIASITDVEVVLIASDKHLITHCSVLKQQQDGRNSVVLASVVHIHNGFGRAYMVFVGPGHKLVVRAMLANAG